MKPILLAILFLTIISCEMNKPLVIGHRGAMGHEMQNTLASIQKALDLGVDMIEIDVFKIKSGEIVVFHDDRLEDLSDGIGLIEEYSLDDLNKVVLNGNHKIPQLQEVLELIDHKVKLNIELKGANTAKDVNAITNQYIKEKSWKESDFIISSFNWDELKSFRKHNATMDIAVLIESEDPLEALPIANELNAVAINPYFKTLNTTNVKKMKDAGFKINTWTVNEPDDIQKMKNLKVDGIITNFPERVN